MSIEARLESSHNKHKGLGGDRIGNRSETANLCTLCGHRHQWGLLSVAKGTLLVKFLTFRGFDGPVAWLVDWGVFARAFPLNTPETRYREIARESAPGVLEALAPWQQKALEILAEMEL